MDTIRTLTENCHHLQGFLIYHSIGGGTGSGFTELLMKSLRREYAKKVQLEFAIYPSPDHLSTAIVEPYNAVLGIQTSRLYADCTFIFENESLFDMCRNNLGIYLRYIWTDFFNNTFKNKT
jgi:tubulin alpha